MRPSNSTAEDMYNSLFSYVPPNTNPSSPPSTFSAQSSNSSPSQAGGFGSYASPTRNPNTPPFQTYQPYAYGNYSPTISFQQSPAAFGNPHYQHQPHYSAFNPYPPTPINYPQFGNINTPPRNPPEIQPETQTQPETQSETEPESQPQPEPEPAPKRGRSKGKSVDTGATRVQVRWSDEEAVILSQRWIHRSEKDQKGAAQAGEVFWRKVEDDYNQVAPQTRSKSQLQGKWNKIRSDSKIFIGIYKELTTPYPSGAKEEDIIKACHKRFKDRTRRDFIYETSWMILKDHPKFLATIGVMSNREAPSQPELPPIDLNDDMPYSDPLTANMQHLFTDDPIRRPPGRTSTSSRKSQKSSGSSDAATSSRSLKEQERLANIRAATEAERTMLEIGKAAAKKTIIKSWKMLMQPVPKFLKGKEKKMIKEVRKTLVNNYESDYKTYFGHDAGSGSTQVAETDEDEDDNEDDNETDNESE